MTDHRRVADQHRKATTLFLLRFGMAVAPLALSVAANAAAFDADVSYTSDDNVTRGIRDRDILDDTFFGATAGVSLLRWINVHNRVVYRAFLHGEKYDKYDGLSNVSAGGQITYQYRGSGRFTTPTYAAFFRAAIVEYDSDLRDSNLYKLGVSWRKPMTDRITFFAQFSGDRRDSDSTAFDTKELSLLANVDYSIGSWTTYLTWNYLDGDIVSVATPTWYPSLYIVNAADEINIDDVFDGRVAYRLEATTNVATLGVNFRISEQHSLDASARYAKSDAGSGIEYERWLYSLAYLIRF